MTVMERAINTSAINSGANEKSCSVCQKVKPLSAFYKETASSDGRGRRCRACQREYMVKRQASQLVIVSTGAERSAPDTCPKISEFTKKTNRARWSRLCDVRSSRAALELDHIVAVSFGGSHAPWNCRLVCQPCHKSRRKEETAHRKRLRAEGALPEKRK